MDLEKIEEAMKKMVDSLDRGTHLETVIKDEGGFRVILSKANHSDRATLSKELLADFLERGEGGREIRKVLGKVVSKLNRMAQKRR